VSLGIAVVIKGEFGEDLRIGPTWGGAIDFSIGDENSYHRIVVPHERLDEVIQMCETLKALAEQLKAIQNPK